MKRHFTMNELEVFAVELSKVKNGFYNLIGKIVRAYGLNAAALSENNVNTDGSTKDGASAFKAGLGGRSFNTPVEVKEFSQGAVKEVLRKILVRLFK